MKQYSGIYLGCFVMSVREAMRLFNSFSLMLLSFGVAVRLFRSPHTHFSFHLSKHTRTRTHIYLFIIFMCCVYSAKYTHCCTQLVQQTHFSMHFHFRSKFIKCVRCQREMFVRYSIIAIISLFVLL